MLERESAPDTEPIEARLHVGRAVVARGPLGLGRVRNAGLFGSVDSVAHVFASAVAIGSRGREDHCTLATADPRAGGS